MVYKIAQFYNKVDCYEHPGQLDQAQEYFSLGEGGGVLSKHYGTRERCEVRVAHSQKPDTSCHVRTVTLEGKATQRAICSMYDQHFQQGMDQPGMVANPARGQLNIFFSKEWMLRRLTCVLIFL